MDLERFTENILISVNGVHNNENISLFFLLFKLLN